MSKFLEVTQELSVNFTTYMYGSIVADGSVKGQAGDWSVFGNTWDYNMTGIRGGWLFKMEVHGEVQRSTS